MGGRIAMVLVGSIVLGAGIGGLVAEVSFQAEMAPATGAFAGGGLGTLLCAFLRD